MSGEVMQFPETIQEFLEQYKIVDTEQVYTNGAKLIPVFRVLQWYDAHITPKKPQSNADRIRAMTDEELAEWLAEVCEDPHNGALIGVWLDWLRQEVEE